MKDYSASSRRLQDSSKQHAHSFLLSFNGNSSFLFYIWIITILMLSSLWLAFRPYQNTDLLLADTINYSNDMLHSVASRVKIDFTRYDTFKDFKSSNHLANEFDEVKETRKSAAADGITANEERIPTDGEIHGHTISDKRTSSTLLHDEDSESKLPYDIGAPDESTLSTNRSPSENDAFEGAVNHSFGHKKDDASRVSMTEHMATVVAKNIVGTIEINDSSVPADRQCEVWRGEWVPDKSPPLYTNSTCAYIHPPRNCMLNGRPDRGYLYWRWKPSECELPRFNASYFLEMLRGQKLAFVGDSLARDHGESLACALIQVENAEKHEWQLKWYFPSYNFTLAILWSPFLVQHSMDQSDLAILHLDVPDKEWTAQLNDFDIAIFSTGYWHFRRSVYYTNNATLGWSEHAEANVTKIDVFTEFRMTMETVLRYIATEYRGVAMIRTVTVDHFEHGVWDAGGICNRTRPYASKDVAVPEKNARMNEIQIEEFMKAMALVDSGSPRFLLLNVTQSSFLRPDGHPGLYRNHVGDTPHDCLHWCLPGPVDMWNQLVMYTLQPIYTGRRNSV